MHIELIATQIQRLSFILFFSDLGPKHFPTAQDHLS